MTGDSEEKSSAETLDEWRNVVLRRRWWLILPTFVVWVAVFITTWFLPATYRSETLILVEAQKIPEQYVVPNVASDFQERLQSMTQQILSRTRLLRVIEQNNLYASLRERLSADEVVERMRKDITVELVQAPSRQQDVTAFKIYYSASSPKLAQRITGELTRLFIDENLRVRQEQSESTTEFLESQLSAARENLSRQEARVREFKTRYLGELPAQVQTNLQILAGLQTELQGELDALNRAKQQNMYLKSLLTQYRSIQAELRTGTGSAALPPAIDTELNRLRNELNDLNARYTDRHPDVRKLKEQLAKTQAMKRQMATELTSERPSREQAPNLSTFTDLRSVSAMLEVESQLKANELEIVNRQNQVTRITGEIGMYQTRLNRIPVREQQMADLTRDYDTSRTNYDSLLAKRNQSELATNLEKRQQGEQFRMLDPPSLPPKPYWPDRLKLSLIALAAGSFVGCLCTVVLEFMDGSIRSEKDVRDILPVRMFTSIPPLLTEREKRQRRMQHLIEGVSGFAMLLVVLGAMAIVYRKG